MLQNVKQESQATSARHRFAARERGGASLAKRGRPLHHSLSSSAVSLSLSVRTRGGVLELDDERGSLKCHFEGCLVSSHRISGWSSQEARVGG
jgi:hypothetical protein